MGIEKKNIVIGGMHCKSCEMLLNDVLSDIEGVKEVSVSANAGLAIISFDPEKTNEEALRVAIRSEGYETK